MNDEPTAVETDVVAFLTGLRAHLRDSREPLYRVVIDTDRRHAGKDEILIGVGDADSPQEGICLNNKGMKDSTGGPFPSVSQFVMSLDEAHLHAACAKLGERSAPQEVLRYATLVVEDISPDSCFGLLVFLARLASVAKDAIPQDWLDYVNRWEGGDVLTTGTPYESWGALHNALSHSYLSPAELEDIARGTASPSPSHSGVPLQDAMSRRAMEGWRRGLLYLVELLLRDATPSHLPRDLPIDEHQRALVWLRQEEQEYLRSLDFATRVQLLLPVRGHTERHLLLDAYIATELTALGAKKIFLRRDSEHAELKQGFGLMALYRPDLAGTGADMVISVDPATGTTLEALWLELERIETERWQGARPADHPRRGIIGYSDDEGQPMPGAPNEPWYDTYAQHHADPFKDQSYTLIAAPRRIDDHTLGTKLAWGDVVDALWRLYHPGRKLKLETAHGLCALEDCRAELFPIPAAPAEGAAPKRLILARWPRPEQGAGDRLDPFPLFTSTLRRLLAACAAGACENGEIRIGDLSEEAEFDFLHLPGGLAVIHRRGVFLLDDWRTERLRADELRQELCAVVKRLEAIAEARRELAQTSADIHAMMQGRGRQAILRMLGALTALRLRIHNILHDTETRSDRHEVREFRKRLEERWGIAGALSEAFTSAKDMEDNLRAYSQARTGFIAKVLLTFTFPLIVVVNWFGVLKEALAKCFDSTFWLMTAIYIAVLVAVLLGFWLIQRNKP